jgi:hypothetical protein
VRLRRDGNQIRAGAEDGVKRAEVITARLVQDERGWLRLAGWIQRAADLQMAPLADAPRGS